MKQQIVAFAENYRSCMQVLGSSDKDADMVRRVERDVGGISSPATSLLNNRSGIVRLSQMHPPKPQPDRNTRVRQPLRPLELLDRNIRSCGGRILVDGVDLARMPAELAPCVTTLPRSVVDPHVVEVDAKRLERPARLDDSERDSGVGRRTARWPRTCGSA